jgi:hypothetical protein
MLSNIKECLLKVKVFLLSLTNYIFILLTIYDMSLSFSYIEYYKRL